MNLTFARSMAIACLTVMRALCWITGGLLLLLTLVQFVRGDADARPVMTLVSGLVFAGCGLAAAWGARRFEDKAN
ncbi:MAG: hypothetical protein MUC58_14885 [Rhizobiaceae bacterium]|jgi:threonine/homoserine/homoserine lactone efflux protein|nr:hypothetical protein [Rhizobiaceae bacterium]MCU0886281.1 hypothetical protein [Beijerinckiaceae bacterium]